MTIKILLSTLILLFISQFQSFSQEKKEEWRYEGPRIGVDLSRFLLPLMQDAQRSGWEIQADIPYKGNWFPTVEIGSQQYDDQRDAFHYKNSGAYARLGVDMNIVKFESLKDHDMLFLGARYGFSAFNQQSDDVTYSNYWGTLNSSVSKRNMTAHWAELLLGMKGELFSNFFLGWTLRAKFPISVSNDPNITPYIIPGIGKTSNGVPFDFSVGLYYRFPIFKTKNLPTPIKVGGNTHPDAGMENGAGGSSMGTGSLRNLGSGGM